MRPWSDICPYRYFSQWLHSVHCELNLMIAALKRRGIRVGLIPLSNTVFSPNIWRVFSCLNTYIPIDYRIVIRCLKQFNVNCFCKENVYKGNDNIKMITFADREKQ
jgi:hypothetical protein